MLAFADNHAFDFIYFSNFAERLGLIRLLVWGAVGHLLAHWDGEHFYGQRLAPKGRTLRRHPPSR